jgi:hypothetical protein
LHISVTLTRLMLNGNAFPFLVAGEELNLKLLLTTIGN